MKILIVRPWPSVLDVTKNTYNIQEVGLAKALVSAAIPLTSCSGRTATR